MFVKTGYSIEPAYSSTLKKSFNASVQNVNFLDASTADIINDWVAQQTKNKIKDVIQQGKNPWFYDMSGMNKTGVI
jgi:serine protease inhibitor